ncbi:MAG: DUF1572 domain-containing protein [Chloroflexota bacterium]|nr:DUF1572 domain-containing protein [Chloroflexota bacterium]
MQAFFTDYLDLMQANHKEILRALEGLPSAALDWTPGSDMNSISVLIFHLTGAERYWIGDVAAQDPKERDRDAEFRVREVDAGVLKKRLADNLEYARNMLGNFNTGDLEAPRVSSRDGRTYSVAWALLHALEHTALHLGQIQLTRQLWEQAENNI